MARNDRLRRSSLILVALCLASIIILARPAPTRSETGTSPWIAPVAVATDLAEAARPSLAFTNDGVEHAVWEMDGLIYYATQPRNQVWSPPHKIASGISPVLVKADSGRLRAIFVNQFMGNYEVYAITLDDQGAWSLPINISHTSGFSAFPVAIAGGADTVYVAWMDNSPGYWTTYVGTWNGEYWSNQPIAHARGQAPALSLAPNGTLYLAWQDRVPSADNQDGNYHIFFSERRAGSWTLPVDISAQPQVESIGPNLTTTPDGLAHLTWVDGDLNVRYGFGLGSYWPEPVTAAQAAVLARGPHIVSQQSDRLYIVWDEGTRIRTVSAPPMTLVWPKAEVIPAALDDMSDVTLTMGPGNEISLGWIQTRQPQDVAIFESWQPSTLTPRAWLPLIMR